MWRRLSASVQITLVTVAMQLYRRRIHARLKTIIQKNEENLLSNLYLTLNLLFKVMDNRKFNTHEIIKGANDL
jgi:hypothetical protein